MSLLTTTSFFLIEIFYFPFPAPFTPIGTSFDACVCALIHSFKDFMIPVLSASFKPIGGHLYANLSVLLPKDIVAFNPLLPGNRIAGYTSNGLAISCDKKNVLFTRSLSIVFKLEF